MKLRRDIASVQMFNCNSIRTNVKEAYYIVAELTVLDLAL